jgi:ATP-dependent DNA helicase RecG
MDGPEQNAAIGALRDGSIRALVSTTVVEVGVDVPDANLIAIEHAEMFGLAQLHQLRGRVGRGGGAAWCFLLPASEDKVERLRRFADTLDGFQIAELDMEERGAGDLEGLEQSGGSLGRSGLLQEHVGLLERWRDRIDGVLRGDEPLTDEERARFSAWFSDERLGEPVAG